jgi:hypothetical protein
VAADRRRKRRAILAVLPLLLEERQRTLIPAKTGIPENSIPP